LNQKINFSKLTCVTDACPTQWEGFTDDGHGVYIRYRAAHFRVYISENVTASSWDAVPGGNPLAILVLELRFDDRDPLDGHMSDEECINHLRIAGLLDE
jgi:hypothetical protein